MRKITGAMHFLFLIAPFLVIGCSGQMSNSGLNMPNGRGIVYPLTAEEADSVLSQAMVATFPGSPISGVSLPNKGYTVTITFLLDSHHITATEIPAFGRDSGGKRVAGYSFEVDQAGTMPVSGGERATALFETINQRATAIKPPIPAV